MRILSVNAAHDASAWLNINDTRQCMNDVFSSVFYLKAPEESGKND